MDYDASRKALYHPGTRPPLSPHLFADNPDALCAELSRLAYVPFEDDPTSLKQALAAHGLGRFQAFCNAKVGTQGFAAMDTAGTAYVVFRGTEPDSLRDLGTDLSAMPVGWIAGTRVHKGFARAYDPPKRLVTKTQVNPRAAIDAWLEASEHRRLVCTGHSLGAALATLLAADRKDAELVTIGSPRVGDAAFAELFDGRPVRRYVDCADGITIVPPPVIYVHVGKMAYIDRKGRLHGDGIGSLIVLADRTAANLAYAVRHAVKVWRNVSLRALADHAPINYVSALLGVRRP